jgi:hypothetical protein
MHDLPEFLRTVSTPAPGRVSPSAEATRRALELDGAMQRM